MTSAYEVRLHRAARRYLDRCDRPTQKRVVSRLEELATAPYQQSKALQGTEGERSSRVGKIRIIFEPDDTGMILHVYAIGPRGNVYDRM